MGSARTNFYRAAFDRQGFGEQLDEVQRLWQAGDREAAGAAVPREIGFRTNLLGTDDTVRDTLAKFADAGIDTLRVTLTGNDTDEKLASLARLLELL